jgi:ABC-type phosphate transport system substrate-binding protein
MKRLSLAILILVLGLTAAAWVSADESGFRVVVNPNNPITSVDRTFLQDAFLKRIKRWPDDEALRPVDLEVRSGVRKHFSKQVLGRSVQAVRAYWQQRIFSGRDVPPPELASDQEVIGYVLRYPGAVGYVSAGVDLKGAKVVRVRD